METSGKPVTQYNRIIPHCKPAHHAEPQREIPANERNGKSERQGKPATCLHGIEMPGNRCLQNDFPVLRKENGHICTLKRRKTKVIICNRAAEKRKKNIFLQ